MNALCTVCMHVSFMRIRNPIRWNYDLNIQGISLCLALIMSTYMYTYIREHVYVYRMFEKLFFSKEAEIFEKQCRTE